MIIFFFHFLKQKTRSAIKKLTCFFFFFKYVRKFYTPDQCKVYVLFTVDDCDTFDLFASDKNSIKRTGKRTNAFTNYDMLYPLYSTLHTGYNYN